MLDRAAQEPDRGQRLLVAENFDVRQPGGVVDRDVHELPALRVRDAVMAAGALAPQHAVAGPRDPPELLDVDMDQLPGTLTLVAHRGLQAQAPELAHPDLRQDPRHGRVRHAEHLGDLRAGHPQPAQRGDRFDAAFLGAVGDTRRS